MSDNPDIVFAYQSSDWSQEKFAAAGGFVAVVLNYNKRDLIRAAVIGALQQDYDCYELLFLDDCSSDGSEQIMLETVEEFVRSRSDVRSLKITVAFNHENRSTLGQWQLAVKLSAGRWFVMFCGDDVSYPQRLKVMCRVLAEHPDLIAACANAEVESADGKKTLCSLTEDLVWHAGDADRPYYFLYGCTAMWRRDVLLKLYGRYNLDDFIVFWLSVIVAGEDPKTEIVWHLSESTICYSDTAGVSSEIKNATRSSNNWLVSKWREASATRSFGKKYGINSWNIIADFDKRYGHPGMVRDQIYGYRNFGLVESGSWLQRLRALYTVYFSERHLDYGGKGAWIRATVRRYFLDFILGNVSYVFLAGLRTMRDSLCRL